MAISYPFLIKAFNYNTEESKISRLAHLLENITFRYLIRGGRAEIEARLNPYLVRYCESTDVNVTIDEIISNLKHNGYWSYWNDETLYENVDADYFYKNRVDNYLLWKYELSLGTEDHPHPINVSYEDLIKNESIEHIAPVTPTDENPVANGYGVYEDSENKSNGIQSGGWLNCVGNLMLIAQGHNSSISNGPFANKLKTYGERNLLNQQRQIVNFIENVEAPVWNKDSIERRHKHIVEFACNYWSLETI